MVATTAELRTLVAGTPAQPFLEEHNGRMFDSIRSVASSATAALEYIAAQDDRAEQFSVRDWVSRGRQVPRSRPPACSSFLMRPDRSLLCVRRFPRGCGWLYSRP